MKKIIYIALILTVIVAALIGVLLVLDFMSLAEAKDSGIKILAAIMILTAASIGITAIKGTPNKGV